METPDGECVNLAITGRPTEAVRFRIYGRPNSTVELWVEKPGCGVEPFGFSEVTLDGTGAAGVGVEHGGSLSCSDGLLGSWRAWVVDGADRSSSADVVFSNAACTQASLCSAAAGFCPTADLDAGAARPDGGTGPDGGAQPDGGAGADGGPADSGWAWSQRWPGLVFEPTAADPERRIDLPIPGGATVRRLSVAYDVDIGQVVSGTRHQFSFTCADQLHPYRGGLFGFLFLGGELGRYTFRNGRPGEGATEPTKLSFQGARRTVLRVELQWDAVAGRASLRVRDDLGGVASVTSTLKVEPMFVPKAVSTIFGFNPITQPNPAESASIGWKYRNLEVMASP